MKKQMNWLLGMGTLVCGLILAVPYLASATATTNILITEMNNHRVIEVDPNTHNIVWQYGQTGVIGSGTNQLQYPWEAVRLTNGNTLIADHNLVTHYGRVIEVTPAKDIVWEYKGHGGNLNPIDVRKLANDNVLIAGSGQVLEVTPVGTNSATVVWQCGADIPLSDPTEAEKRPGTSTNYYLITDRDNHRVIEVQASGTSGGTIVWQYGTGVPGSGTNQLYEPYDAKRLISGTILITEGANHRVIEVQPTGTSGGTIIWECSANTGLPLNQPWEAIRMSNGNTLIADINNHRVIEVRTQNYPSFTSASIVWQQEQVSLPTDVEELGIVNIAKAEYKDLQGKDMPIKFAGIVVPLGTPTVNLPEITLSKSVYPMEPVQIGATLTYTIRYENVGTGTAKDVRITDMVPDSTEYVVGSAKDTYGPTAAESYSHDGGLNFDDSESGTVTHVRWSIDEVVSGGWGTLEFKVQVK